eukprot:4133904-Amphidinium_carterae.1
MHPTNPKNFNANCSQLPLNLKKICACPSVKFVILSVVDGLERTMGCRRASSRLHLECFVFHFPST